jgi:hypothetical protein
MHAATRAEAQEENNSERRAREMSRDLHGASYAFLHRWAAAESLIRCKVHALLAIGSESSDALVRILLAQLPTVMPHEGALLTRFVGVLIRHDEWALAAQRPVWQRRDSLLATRQLLHNLARAVHRDTPAFTLSAVIDQTEVQSG